MSRSRLIIAIDGPAASGKSTTARLVAERLGYVYIDTGAMYRALTVAALRAGIDPGDQVRMERLADECVIELRLDDQRRLRVFLNGRDVSSDIRTPEVTACVSRVSSHAGVRRRLVELQRSIGAGGGIVMDGRDIGTVVFPDADVKIFMVADIHARAERRKAELHTLGNDVTLAGLASQLEERDRLDSTRDISPLRKADDAVEIDTSSLSIEEQVERVVGLALERGGE
ncbi:MAG TPA: (d)CMP kinase [Candidatus Kapabacteria bacterium]|nr:(d)CMP kinase [Candidatus Kapabacteria bacterium]